MIALMAVVLYGLDQPAVRISNIAISGGDNSLAEIAKGTLYGRYFGIIPRDSIIFFPASAVRARIFETHPNIASLSILRKGFSGIEVQVHNRVPIARWCGATPNIAIPALTSASSTRFNLVTDCYVFDDSGFIFATTSDTPYVNSFDVYMTATTSKAVIGSTLPRAGDFPAIFNFARELSSLGSPVKSIVIRGSEVDTYLESGTRITYEQSREQDAFTALVSAGSHINLKDGSLEYVDLRFDGNVYIKKKGGTVPK